MIRRISHVSLSRQARVIYFFLKIFYDFYFLVFNLSRAIRSGHTLQRCRQRAIIIIIIIFGRRDGGFFLFFRSNQYYMCNTCTYELGRICVTTINVTCASEAHFATIFITRAFESFSLGRDEAKFSLSQQPNPRKSNAQIRPD